MGLHIYTMWWPNVHNSQCHNHIHNYPQCSQKNGLQALISRTHFSIYDCNINDVMWFWIIWVCRRRNDIHNCQRILYSRKYCIVVKLTGVYYWWGLDNLDCKLSMIVLEKLESYYWKNKMLGFTVRFICSFPNVLSVPLQFMLNLSLLLLQVMIRSWLNTQSNY
jgi:hypothetical protein